MNYGVHVNALYKLQFEDKDIFIHKASLLCNKWTVEKACDMEIKTLEDRSLPKHGMRSFQGTSFLLNESG